MGRGLDGSTFDEALAEARQTYQSPCIQTLYLLGKPLFMYVPAGVEKLQKEGFELA